MRAAVVPAVGGRWEVREVATPEPGPTQVLIRIHASGLCFTDVHITHGAIPTQFPRTLGHEPVSRGSSLRAAAASGASGASPCSAHSR
jgi:alcohol dehydrogenase